MIGPSPSANSGQVVSERPASSYSSPLTATDPRAPQTNEIPIESPESSPSRSPQEVLETHRSTEGDLHMLRSDPHAYIPPPAGSETSSTSDFRSSPQVYPEPVHTYHQDGILHQNEPNYTGVPYTYPQPYPQPYPQLYVQPYFPQPAIPQPQLQETPHLPLDYISLPTTTATRQQTSTSNHSSTHNNASQVASHPNRPNRPYPTPAPTTSSPVQHGSVDVGLPSTPIKQPPRRSYRKRWICLFLLIVVAIAVAVGVVMSKKNSDKEMNSDEGGDPSNGDKGPQSPSPNATTIVTTTSHTMTSSAPPTKPTSPPVQPPPSDGHSACGNACYRTYIACEEKCKSEDPFKSCMSGCSGDFYCEAHCNTRSCFSNCLHNHNRCTSSC